jgi:hypothetical protein
MKKLIVASAYPIRFTSGSSYKVLREVITASRLSFNPDDFNFKVASERISEIRTEKVSFDDCLEKRIQEIESKNKPVYVFWSGGVDSTAALVSILKFGSSDLKKRTTVLFNCYSIKEYPDFFPLIAANFKMESSFERLSGFVEKGILVTGELGDQIFGSDIIFDLVPQFGEESLFDPYQNVLPKLFKNRAGDEKGIEVFRKFENIVNEAPFPIKSAFDFLWWWNFSQKWQHVKYRFLLIDDWNSPKAAVENVFHFYDSPLFQSWSLQNHDLKISKKLISYKQIVKDFIVKETRHSSYLTKMKMGSLGYVWFGKKAHFAVDEDYNYVQAEKSHLYLKGKI